MRLLNAYHNFFGGNNALIARNVEHISARRQWRNREAKLVGARFYFIANKGFTNCPFRLYSAISTHLSSGLSKSIYTMSDAGLGYAFT